MKLEDLLVTRNWVGKPVQRKEDLRLLRGEASYVDDLDLDCYHAAFLRSPYPHALIKKIDTSKAEALEGVLGVITGEDIARETKPVSARAITRNAVQYVMAVGKVRYVGEAMVAVVAVDPYIAQDAVDLIEVEYEPLPPVVRIKEAIKDDATLIFEEAGTNILMHDTMVHGDLEAAYQEADLTLKEEFNVHRYSSTPLEPWAIIAQYEKGEEAFVVWSNDQQHGRSLVNVCNTLGVSNEKMRMIIPDSGGGFGIKLALWPHTVIIALLAKKVDKPVKWIQTRREHLLFGSHAPDGILEIEMALKKDGRILAVKIKDMVNDGSFVHTAGIYSLIKFATMVGCYQIKATSAELMSVVTNQAPTVQNRGVGKPTMNFVLERMVDIAAKKLGLDRLEIRRRNFVQPEQMPYTTPSGEIYESGNYPEVFRKTLEMVDYDGFLKKQADLRKEGKYLGIGISSGVEPGTSNLGYYYTARGTPDYMGNADGAIVGMDFDGNINVVSGSVDSGQGHGTTVSQVIADMLAITPDRVYMPSRLDTHTSAFAGHSGTYSNKFHDIDLGAIIMATKKVRDKMFKLAAHMLQTDQAKLQLKEGAIYSTGDEKKSVTFKELASVAYKQVLLLPEGMEPGLKEIAFYSNKVAKLPNKTNFNIQLTHANSAHAVISEVDIETGTVKLLKYVIVHDCGRQLNPGIVEGMTIGSTVHGIGAVLFEDFVYDDEGQPLATTFMDYMKPLAMSLPKFEIGHLETLCPTTLLGTKSIGEGGSLPSLAAIANSVEDALSPFGVKITSLPITPEKVVKAVQETKVI